MAGLDDLLNQIPVADIAAKLGADQGEVSQAIQTLVPTLLGTLQENVQAEDIDSSNLESAVVAEGQSDLLTGGVNVDQLDEGQGNQHGWQRGGRIVDAQKFVGEGSRSGDRPAE